jgi:RNA polymerase sigma factor (sigma-70 family)
MVWAVCRHLLPDHADAEDAFQATFLALVRSAGTVRQPHAVAGWLHGVAVRVATKVKRSAVRRRQREHKAAGPEADRSVPGSTWDALLAAVHDEVQRLPEPLRAVFVLCDLEGVRQPDAAARLGWKAGTLTGRLARARQVLLERLASRGLAPALAGGTVGLGVATATAAVPAGLTDKLMALTAAGGAVPPAVLKLVGEVTPMVLSRTKLAAAVLLVAGGLGTLLYPAAVAQQTRSDENSRGGGSGGGPPPPAGAPDALPRGGGSPAAPGYRGGPPGTGGAAPGGLAPRRDTGGAPSAAGASPGMSMPGMPGMSGGMAGSMGGGVARAEWEHALVDKPTSSAEFKKILDGRGREGWEFAGVVEFPGEVHHAQLVFKRSRGGMHGGFGGGGAMMGAMGMGSSGGPMMGAPGGPMMRPMGSGTSSGRMIGAMGAPGANPFGAGGPPGVPDLAGGGRGVPGTGTQPVPMRSGQGGRTDKTDGRQIHVIALKNADAASMTTVLDKVFSGDVDITPDPRTNSLIIRASEETLMEVGKLVEKLDQPDGGKPPTGSGRPGGRSGTGGPPPMGGAPGGPPAGRP